MHSDASRRAFLKSAGIWAGAALTGSGLAAQAAAIKSTTPPLKEKFAFHLGLASYTTRKLSLDKTIEIAKRLGLACISLKDIHLPMNVSAEITAQTAQSVRDAGLDLYAGGVIYMNSADDVSRAFDYAKAAGFRLIVGVPGHELLDTVEEKIKTSGIAVAIHNHGPSDKVYPTAEAAYTLLKGRDKRFGLCVDIGHTQRSGIAPAEDIRRFSDRLLDVHIKDVTEATAKGSPVEVGRGVIDIPAVLEALKKIDYKDAVSFEYEKDADDPLPGLAESVGYVHGVMTAINRS